MANLKPISFFNKLILFAAACMVASCISVSPHQTGRTLGEKGVVVQGSYNFGMANEGQVFRIDDEIPEEKEANTVKIHIVEAGVQAAMNDRIDVGLRINNTGHYTMHLKGQIIGNKESMFASSLGAEAGINLFGLSFIMAGYHVSISSFNSVHLTDYLALGFSPRYIYVNVNSYLPLNLSYDTSMFGYSTGLYVGRKHIFSLEFSQYAIDLPYRISHSPMISVGASFRVQ